MSQSEQNVKINLSAENWRRQYEAAENLLNKFMRSECPYCQLPIIDHEHFQDEIICRGPQTKQ